MGSIKVVIRTKKNKHGESPIALRITKDRKSSFVYTGQYIDEKQWDAVKQRVRKSHPNSARLNNLILSKLAEANNKILELETDNPGYSTQAVKDEVKGKSASFFDHADVYLHNLRVSGKYNSYSANVSRIKRFREFLKGRDIAFQDVTVQIVRNFEAYLRGTYGISERTIVNYLIVIRTVYNRAINAGIVNRDYYPFGQGGVKVKFPQTVKIGLSAEEVKLLEDLDLDTSSHLHHARNIWLFSFYFAGMRVSDVLRLRWSDFQNDRLFYKMGKNEKAGSLKVSGKALRILRHYKADKGVEDDFVFPELKFLDDLEDSFRVQSRIAHSVKRLNSSLKEVAKLTGITKKLTTHIARHTFGNISGDRISVQMLQKLYSHSSISTTIGYQSNFVHKDADDALESVISC